MAVRLLREKLSASIPNWVRDAILSGDNKYAWQNFPLDSLEFIKKPVPSTFKSIQNDYDAGHTPVIEWTHIDYNGNVQKAVQVLTPVHWVDSKRADYLFKKAFEDSLPRFIANTYEYSKSWRDVKDDITKYGIIAFGEKEMGELANLRTARRNIKPMSPETIARKYKSNLKKDADALRSFKQLDATYDEINDLFDKGMAKLDSLTDRDANAIFDDMGKIKNKYDFCVKRIEGILAREPWLDYQNRDSMYDFKSYDNAYDDLLAEIEAFKNKWNV